MGRDCGHFFGSKPKPSLLFTSFKAPYLMPAGMEETRPAQLTLQSARNRNAAIHIQNVVLSLSLPESSYLPGRPSASSCKYAHPMPLSTRCLSRQIRARTWSDSMLETTWEDAFVFGKRVYLAFTSWHLLPLSLSCLRIL